MDFSKRRVRSRPGLTQEQALVALQDSPFFYNGTRIASIKPAGDRWVADLLIPRTAADDEGGSPFPPKPEGDEGEPSGPPEDDDGDGDDDGGEPGPPGAGGPPGEGKEKKPGKGGADQQIVTLLTEILHALQGGPPGGGMGGPDDLGPGMGGPPAPPPHGGPAGGPAGPPGGGKLRPGEVPNRPGVNPVGAPAFSHTHTGMGPSTPGAPPVPGAGAGAAVPGPTGGGGTCPHCGGMLGPDGTCPTCGGAGGAGAGGGLGGGVGAGGMGMYASLEQKIASVAGKVPTLTVSAQADMSIKEAKAQLEAVAGPYGYKVKQIRRVNGRPRALLSVR